VNGIAEGRDEVVEAAVRLISESAETGPTSTRR
jgi:hypothetical protein